MSSRKLEKRGIAVIALVFWMLIISFASPVYAANNIAVNSSSNSTLQETTAIFTELNGANLSVSTDSGELYYMVSLDMRNNRTAWSAKTYGAFVIDGVRQRTMNLTRMAYPFNIVVAGSSTVTSGGHTVAFEVNHSGTRKGMIYSNNFSVRFLKTGAYTTLTNATIQINRSQVTWQVTVDNTQNSSISTLQGNDTTHDSQISSLQSNDTTDRSYVNDSFLKLDGTSAMTGDLNQGGNYLTNSSSVNALNAKGAGYSFKTTSYINIPISTSINSRNNTSIVLSLKLNDGVTGANQRLFNSIGSVYRDGFISVDGGLKWYSDSSPSSTQLQSTKTDWAANTIYNLVFTYDGSDKKLYIDGILDKTHNIGDVEFSSMANPLTFGQTSGGISGEYYNVYIYNRALTASEVKALSSGAPVAYADIGADNVNVSSGTLTLGKRYRIVDFNIGDDFVNVGGTNVTGNEFIATGTTPTNWTNSSVLKRIGAVGQWEQDGIRTNTWIDKSGNNNNGIVSGTIAINMNPHIESNGSDHSFIDQDVTNGASPIFSGTNIAGFITNATVNINVSNATGTLDEARIDSDIARDSEVAALDGVKIKPFIFVIGTTSGLQNMVFKAPFNLTIEAVDTYVHGTGNGNITYQLWKNTSSGFIDGNPLAADSVFTGNVSSGRYAANTSISQAMAANDTLMINVSTATATGATIELEIYV